MSAFVVEDSVINRVIGQLASLSPYSGAARILRDEQGLDITNSTDQTRLGKMMFDLNCSAVEQRYGAGEAKSFRDLDYSYRMELVKPIQAYKSLRCWLYQCSEGDVPEASLLYASMARIAGELAEEIVSHLPAYEKAQW